MNDRHPAAADDLVAGGANFADLDEIATSPTRPSAASVRADQSQVMAEWYQD